MKIEESERLAALLTAQEMDNEKSRYDTYQDYLRAWRAVYQARLREFIELEKAELSRMRDE